MAKVSVWLVMTGLLVSCGGQGSHPENRPSQSVDGTWVALTPMPTSGPTPPTFTFTMTHGSGTMMGLGNFHLLTPTACFGPGSVMTSSGQMGGGMMGPGTQITMDLWSNPDATGNHLTLVMVMNGAMNGMTGTYVLTGVTPGCSSGSGTITMTHP